ncbi:TTN [Mytilus coruscus]|uniref:TTN n=1 Tax=Mytilus coruscus TaxID=42192 RepID=A0A6J8DMZ0_MYTCO|nr:TTN [Mytilus coruscus]
MTSAYFLVCEHQKKAKWIDFAHISQIHGNGNVCISWSLYKEQLRIVCKTDNLHLAIIFCNPSGDEVAYCSVPFPKTECHPSEKQNNITQDISSGETLYVVKRTLSNHLLNGLWSCYHGFILDKASVEVIVPKSIDITGPFITSDKDFPLSAGSVVELTCKTISRDYVIEMYMNCLETVVKSNRSNNGTYVAKLSKMVKSSDNGTMCKCKTSSVITTSSSIKLHIIRAPILDTIDMVFCNNTESVILSCRVSGEMSEFGFSPWVHRFHGTYIRSVAGNVTGNVSFLSIDSCNYEDNGEYICEAWNKDSQQIFRQKSSTRVIVKGPPIVVDQTVTMSTTVTLSAKFLSMQSPHNPKWYHKNRLLPNSTRYHQNTSENIIVIRMYGQILTFNGYIANLTVVKQDIGRFKFLLLLGNDFGTEKSIFELNNHDNDSERKSASRAVYFAAAGQTNNVNIYDVTSSPYEEINDGDLVPEHSNNLMNQSVVNDADDYQEEDVRQYLELE